MKLKIDSTSKPLTHCRTSIGQLYIFNLRVKDSISLDKKLGKELESFTTEEFFKLYLPFFAYPEKTLIGKNLERPEEYTLTKEDVAKLTNDDLENLAKVFIEKNSYLYKNRKIMESKKGDGMLTVSFEEDDKIDDDLLKKDAESYIDYAYRLIVRNDKKQKEQMRQFTSSFSSGLSENIAKTMKLGKVIQNSLEPLKNLSIFKNETDVSIEPMKREFPQIDFIEIARKEEEARWAPFKHLSKKIDLMIDAEKETVGFMENMYETQVQISNELKSSSDSANKNSKLNIKFTLFIIALTVISMIVSTFSFTYSVWFNNDTEKLVQANKDIELSVSKANLQLEQLNKILVEQNSIQKKQIEALEINLNLIMKQRETNLELNTINKDLIEKNLLKTSQ